MTVKCFTDWQKDNIAQYYKTKQWSITELATMFVTSPRTIGRILEEKGLASPVSRLKGEAYRAMKLLEQYGLTVDQLEVVLHHNKHSVRNASLYAPNEPKNQTAALFRQPIHTNANLNAHLHGAGIEG